MARRVSKKALLVGLTLVGCSSIANLTEVRLDEEDGIPAVEETAEIAGLNANNFRCGDQIADDDGNFTITSVDNQAAGQCELTMVGQFEVIGADDYEQLGSLDTVSIELVKAIELEVQTLEFVDLDNGTEVDAAATFSDLSVTVSDVALVDEATIDNLPATVTLEGAIVEGFRENIAAREPVLVDAEIFLAIPDAALGALPDRLGLDFRAQPAVILGVEPLIR